MAEGLERRRVTACRLDPRLALVELDDAVAFVADRGLLTLTPCCALPSLFGACHEEPHSPGKGGYGQYPRTRWWWGGALADTAGVTATKLHRGKTLYLAAGVVEMVAPLCAGALDEAMNGGLGGDAQRVVELLAAAGPSTTDDLKDELGLDAKRYQRAKAALERQGAVLSRGLTVETAGGGHRHVSELRIWDRPAGRRARIQGDLLVDLLVAVVTAAVVLPEADARRAFSWPISEAVVEQAVADGRVVRAGPATLALRL
jgi:hypothetical protein